MTHAEKVLKLLSDGEPHDHMEGYRLGVMLHSRVADLRKKGYAIRCWREGDFYLYELDGSLEQATVQVGGVCRDSTDTVSCSSERDQKAQSSADSEHEGGRVRSPQQLTLAVTA